MKDRHAEYYNSLKAESNALKLRTAEVKEKFKFLNDINEFETGADVALEDLQFFGNEWVYDIINGVETVIPYDLGYVALVNRVKELGL